MSPLISEVMVNCKSCGNSFWCSIVSKQEDFCDHCKRDKVEEKKKDVDKTK